MVFWRSMSFAEKLKQDLKKSPFIWRGVLTAQRLGLALKRKTASQAPRTGFDLSEFPQEPVFSPLTSQLVTRSQFMHPDYFQRCLDLGRHLRLNRKSWEYCYILQALIEQGMVKAGKRGVGFGCGEEPMPAFLVKQGVFVTATDQSFEKASSEGWTKTGEHLSDHRKMNWLGLSEELLVERCRFKEVDMNAIPADLQESSFDFLWSACAFEHLGSLEHGLRFVESAMACLKPGGVAVHTTEFNVSSNEETLETPSCSVFRKKDLERLSSRLAAQGHRLLPLNLNPGFDELDRLIDLPPYRPDPHLKLKLESFDITSVGLIIIKG